jgi:hypothetical protein
MNLTISARKRLAAGAAIACLAIGVPTVALAASSAPLARPSTPRCNNSNTYVWFALSPNGAAGTIYYPVEFSNTGSSACTLAGFPGVSAVNKSDHQLGLAAKRTRGFTAHTVTIQPGQTAHAMLGITEAEVIGGCHNATASGLKVYPPNEFTKQLVMHFTFSVCTNKPSMRVYPVTPGIGVP